MWFLYLIFRILYLPNSWRLSKPVKKKTSAAIQYGPQPKTKKEVFKNLNKACNRRWLSFNNSVASLYEHLPAPLVTQSSLPESDAMAYCLLKNIKSAKFISTLYILQCSLSPGLNFNGILKRESESIKSQYEIFLAGNIYSICDRYFGNIQRFFVSIEVIQVLQQWVTVLRKSHILNVEGYLVRLNMIKAYTFFLRLQCVGRNVDLEDNKVEVRNYLVELRVWRESGRRWQS